MVRSGKPGKKNTTKEAGSQQPGTRPLPRNPADRLILQNSNQILSANVLLMLPSGTALAERLVEQRPELRWNIYTLEHFYLTSVINALSDENGMQKTDAELELFCTPDPPDDRFDTIVIPTDSRASAELTRDLLQAAEIRLKTTGRLMVSTNNPRDHWLHQHLKDRFGRITVIRDSDGVCYIARKGERSPKLKQFECEFAFRDGERLIHCVSRPGVFSHRRVDAGARALVRSLSLIDDDPQFSDRPPKRIIDMGCGCGSVTVAAALRYPDAAVIGVDSHARAVQSTELTAKRNQADNVSVVLTSDGAVPDSGKVDIFLCNPPYYSDFRISEIFLLSAAEALRPGGRLQLVTKLTDWHENRMIEIFANAKTHRIGEYDVIVSRR